MYVVNPISIYLLGLVSKLIPILFLSFICFLSLASFFAFEATTTYNKEKIPKYKTLSKMCLISGIIIFVLWVFIPSKETIVKIVMK